MTKLKLSSKTLFFLLIISRNIFAQGETRNELSFASDLSPWMMNGYSLKIGTQIKNHFELSAEIFSIEVPNFIVNLNLNNKNLEWSEKINFGAALYLDRKLTEFKNSIYIGFGLVLLNHTAQNENLKYDYAQMEYMLRLSYKWFPFDLKGLYLQPYIAFAGRNKISGDNGTYSLTPLLVIPSVYLSWKL